MVASRTPEGLPDHCLICGKQVVIDPSSVPVVDATCPHCGSLISFSGELVSCSDETVTIVRLEDPRILEESSLQNAGNELFQLVDEHGQKQIVLDFSNVKYLSSAVLGKLITMDKKVRACGGTMRLRNVAADIEEVFRITRLDEFLS